MKIDELVAMVREKAQQADVSDTDSLAVQINITGKTPGVWNFVKPVGQFSAFGVRT